jgi:hypothetical protein
MYKPCHIPLEYRYPTMKIGHVRPAYFNYLNTEDLLKYECKTYLKEAFVIFSTYIIGAYHTLNHRLDVQIGSWPTLPIGRANKLHHWQHSWNWSTFCVKMPLLFVCLIWTYFHDSLESFYQLDPRFNIIHYLKEAITLRCSTKLAFCTLPWCTSTSYKPLSFLDFTINFVSCAMSLMLGYVYSPLLEYNHMERIGQIIWCYWTLKSRYATWLPLDAKHMHYILIMKAKLWMYYYFLFDISQYV